MQEDLLSAAKYPTIHRINTTTVPGSDRNFVPGLIYHTGDSHIARTSLALVLPAGDTSTVFFFLF